MDSELLKTILSVIIIPIAIVGYIYSGNEAAGNVIRIASLLGGIISARYIYLNHKKYLKENFNGPLIFIAIVGNLLVFFDDKKFYGWAKLIIALCTLIVVVQKFLRDLDKENLKRLLKENVESEHDINTINDIIENNSDLKDLSHAHLQIGCCKQELGDNYEAIDNFEKIISIQPRLAEAHYFRGRIYFNMGEKEKADKDYKIANELYPGFPHYEYVKNEK